MIRVYVSHSIRGKDGPKATQETMEANNRRAIEFGNQLKQAFPNIDFYVPGDHDEFVTIAYLQGIITEGQILDVDCQIVSRCDCLLAFFPDGYFSNGMQTEIEYAQSHSIPLLIAANETQAISYLNLFLENKLHE